MTDMFRIRTAMQITAGNPLLSTMYFDTTGTDAASAASAVSDFWDALAPVLSTSLTWQVESTAAVILAADGSLVGLEPTGTFAPASGSETHDLLPPATQGLVRWVTSGVAGGRIIRGRTFIPGLTEDSSVTGVPTSSLLASLGTAAGDFITAAAGFGIWARPVATGPHARTGVFAGVENGTIWREFAVLRSRRD
jgi:hypothetical protein